MSATVHICESNGVSETVTHNITHSKMGNSDTPNLTPSTYKITPGERSYAKYQRFHVTSLGGSTNISNLKVWRTGALAGGATHVTNARTASYGGAKAYATPVKTAITTVDQTMPTTEPATANLGIAGSLAGVLTAIGYSDYLVHQIVTDVADTAGASPTLNYQYDEEV